MSGIFISYRREDTKPYARLLSDSLASHFGQGKIFRDVDTIGPGADFPEAIAKAVGECDALLALVGKKWVAARQQGKRRLDDPRDYVRLEITTALERGILVVPVLIEDTRMPAPKDLPEPLAEFADRNAHRLTDAGWNDEVKQLIRALEKVVPRAAETQETQPHRPAPGPPAWRPPEAQSQPPSWLQQPASAPSPAPAWSAGGSWAPQAPSGPTSFEPEPAGRGKWAAIAVGAVAAVALVAIALVMILGGDDKKDGGDDLTDLLGQTNTSLAPGEATIPGFGNLDSFFAETNLTISPTTGPAGTTVTVSGSGFLPNERIDIHLHVDRVAQGRADAQGAFSGVTFVIPDDAFQDQQDVVAIGAQSIRNAMAPFRVT
ncbi:MAG: toll/interleukin-1 receptor domain-containing protein [Actinobacteria bacterium]|nr:toll/interleukin-1 receptor domain-containing protein [Actinomycetota bacterium]